MAVNKIVLNTDDGEQVLVDLTGDSVSEGTLFEGETAHAANGKKIVGTFTLESEMSEQDALIEQIKTALEGKAAGSAPLTTQEKSVDITENGVVEVTPDEGYTLSKVTANVNVPIPDGYIKPSGTLNITENGEYDVTDKSVVVVAVQTSGGSGGDVIETAQVNIAYSGMSIFLDGVIESTSPTTEYVEAQISGENITELKVLKGSIILFKMANGKVKGDNVIGFGNGVYQIKAIDDVCDINLYI